MQVKYVCTYMYTNLNSYATPVPSCIANLSELHSNRLLIATRPGCWECLLKGVRAIDDGIRVP